MVEPVLHVLGLDEKDKERSRERSPTRQVSVTHERARSDTPAGSLGHKERPHSRVLSVFGVGSGSRRVSSSDGVRMMFCSGGQLTNGPVAGRAWCNAR